MKIRAKATKTHPIQAHPMIQRTTATEKQSRVLLKALLLVYVGLILILSALGFYTFFWKSLVVPIIFVVAVLSSRTRLFIADWAPFLSLTVVFDSIRGLIFALISRFDLPVYMSYAIKAEQAVLGGHIAPVVLQAALLRDHGIGFLDRFLAVVYGSHFLFFLFFGMGLWLLRRDQFQKYVLAMVALMYLGLLMYFAIPTVPPWMASQEFGIIPHIYKLTSLVYTATIPDLIATFDTNPIAAMPSLHAAFPMLCALIALRVFGLRAWPILVYNASVTFAITYLGEHYFVDALAGWLLASAVYYIVFHRRSGERTPRQPSTPPESEPNRQYVMRTVGLASLALLCLSQGLSQMKRSIEVPFLPSRTFVSRELEGVSPVTEYYTGLLAFRDRDFRKAQQALSHVLGRLSDPKMRVTALATIGRSAFYNRDFSSSASALMTLPVELLDPRTTVLLAVSHARTGDVHRALTQLRKLTDERPDDAESLYWLTRLEYEENRISQAQALQTVSKLRSHRNQRHTTLAEDLASIINEKATASPSMKLP